MSERWRKTDKPIYLVHNFTDQRHDVRMYKGSQKMPNNTIKDFDGIYTKFEHEKIDYKLMDHVIVNESAKTLAKMAYEALNPPDPDKIDVVQE